MGAGQFTGAPGDFGNMYNFVDKGHSVHAGVGLNDILDVGVQASYTPPPFCFPAATSVMMAEGRRKAIKDIKVGDVVMAYNATPGFVSRRVG